MLELLVRAILVSESGEELPVTVSPALARCDL